MNYEKRSYNPRNRNVRSDVRRHSWSNVFDGKVVRDKSRGKPEAFTCGFHITSDDEEIM